MKSILMIALRLLASAALLVGQSEYSAWAVTTNGVNPYVVGTPAVPRYLEVARECVTARLTRLSSQP